MHEIEVIIRLNAMGDILLAVPTLRALAQNDCEIHLVIHQRWRDLAALLPAKVHLFKGTGSLLKLAGELRSLQPRAVYDLQGKLASIALRKLVAAPITRTYQKRSFPEQLRAIRGNYPIRISDNRPVWEKYALACGVTIENPNPGLNISDEYLNECRNIISTMGLEENKFFALHPHASQPGKILPRSLILELQKRLPNITAIIGTDNQELELLENCIDMRNKISLFHLPGVLKMAAAVISSDSGPMHLARAVSTPVAAVFLQTCPTLGFAPIPGQKVLIISDDLPCKPCSLHGQNNQCPEKHFNCRKIDTEKIVSAILDFLETSQ